jgi:hypothetical protein
MSYGTITPIVLGRRKRNGQHELSYGNSDFYKIITENQYYVDRTDRIPLLEEAGYNLLFLRPRRGNWFQSKRGE